MENQEKQIESIIDKIYKDSGIPHAKDVEYKIDKECIVLRQGEHVKHGFNKYQANYSYFKQDSKIEVELLVQSISIFKVFKWLNYRINKENGSLENVKMNVVKIKK